MKAFLLALLLVIVLGALALGAAIYTMTSRGLSTRDAPSRVEALLARAARRLATPGDVRSARNPVEPTPAVLEEALTHFADHCASCHANDGSGNTDLGRSLYPPAPDMRAEGTRSLSDGELFSIIERGIRLTGMPAWGDGTPEGEHASWGLVHFIRRLPDLTAEEIDRMEALNPRPPAEFRAEEEARRFLAGEDVRPAEPPSAEHGH